MIPPKIDICIEGYNIDQTDFYISHMIDKYNSLNELYKKSCEHIVFLEKECKDGFISSLTELEMRIIDKISSLEKRLSDIEKNIVNSGFTFENNNSEIIKNKDDFINRESIFNAQLSDFHSELEDIKSLFTK